MCTFHGIVLDQRLDNSTSREHSCPTSNRQNIVVMPFLCCSSFLVPLLPGTIQDAGCDLQSPKKNLRQVPDRSPLSLLVNACSQVSQRSSFVFSTMIQGAACVRMQERAFVVVMSLYGSSFRGWFTWSSHDFREG